MLCRLHSSKLNTHTSEFAFISIDQISTLNQASKTLVFPVLSRTWTELKCLVKFDDEFYRLVVSPLGKICSSFCSTLRLFLSLSLGRLTHGELQLGSLPAHSRGCLMLVSKLAKWSFSVSKNFTSPHTGILLRQLGSGPADARGSLARVGLRPDSSGRDHCPQLSS